MISYKDSFTKRSPTPTPQPTNLLIYRWVASAGIYKVTTKDSLSPLQTHLANINGCFTR